MNTVGILLTKEKLRVICLVVSHFNFVPIVIEIADLLRRLIRHSVWLREFVYPSNCVLIFMVWRILIELNHCRKTKCNVFSLCDGRARCVTLFPGSLSRAKSIMNDIEKRLDAIRRFFVFSNKCTMLRSW